MNGGYLITIQSFTSVRPIITKPIKTGFDFLDVPLDGGLPTGGAFFLAGPPGSGKSTIATQIIGEATTQGKKVLYIAGEEHPGRQLDRFKRLGVNPGDLLQFYTADKYYIEDILAYLKNNPIDLLIIDSIQKIQTKESTGVKITVTKSIIKLYNYVQNVNQNIAVLAIIQCTKDGKPEGINSNIHEFDGLIQIENYPGKQLRSFYYVKNRFGLAGQRFDAYMTEGGFIKADQNISNLGGNPYPYSTILEENTEKRIEAENFNYNQSSRIGIVGSIFKGVVIVIFGILAAFLYTIFFFSPRKQSIDMSKLLDRISL